MTGFGLTISDLNPQAAGAIRRLFNLGHFYQRQSASCGHGRPLLGPGQSARGLAQSKTLARRAMACVSVKRLGLRGGPPHFFRNVAGYHLPQTKIAT
jgi:hypothetical protein